MIMRYDYFRNYINIIEKKSREYSRCHVIKISRYLLNKYRKYD